MLVHDKIPNGMLDLESHDGIKYRIYGRQFGYPPHDIPFELYNQFREVLQDGTYREDTLQKMFGCQFPMVAFTYGELKYLPLKTLDILGPLMCDEYKTEWPIKRKTEAIKLALRGQDARFRQAPISRWKK